MHSALNMSCREIYSVTRLNREVRAVLEGSFPALWVEGEISNLARPASGHWYFSLKDPSSQVRCAMFKNRNRSIKFSPENGMQVIAKAHVGLYEGRGEFQLVVETLEAAGTGALQQAFARLKEELNREGLFDGAHKQALPAFPRTIGIISSPTGAAVQDILKVLKRRYPGGNVIIYPVAVQGEGAAQQIAGALALANERRECEVLILARGGGSLEDLWAFNEEVIARAIFDSSLPVVSGVGHEIDFSIADFVADQRAPTPSAAAELVSPDTTALRARLSSLQDRLSTHSRHLLQSYRQSLLLLERRLPDPARELENISQGLDDMALRLQRSARAVLALKGSQLLALCGTINSHNPLQRLALYKNKASYLGEQLRVSMSHYLLATRARLRHLNSALHAVSPLATLARGYAIVTADESADIVRDAGTLRPGQMIRTRFARGHIHSSVEKISKDD